MELNWEDESLARPKIQSSKYESQFVMKRWKNRHRKQSQKKQKGERVLRSGLQAKHHKARRKREIRGHMGASESEVKRHIKNKGRKMPQKEHIIIRRKKGLLNQKNSSKFQFQEQKRMERYEQKKEWLHAVDTHCVSYSQGCVLYASNIHRYCNKQNCIDHSKLHHLKFNFFFFFFFFG
ncbi:hypothetical protein RFI_38619, partial [Reticulomyxa filosa]